MAQGYKEKQKKEQKIFFALFNFRQFNHLPSLPDFTHFKVVAFVMDVR